MRTFTACAILLASCVAPPSGGPAVDDDSGDDSSGDDDSGDDDSGDDDSAGGPVAPASVCPQVRTGYPSIAPVWPAADFPAAQVLSVSIGASDPGRFATATGLGRWCPWIGSEMFLMCTGEAVDIAGGLSPAPPGATPTSLTLAMTAPPDAWGFQIRLAFFSREYPEWVGSSYNDSFGLWVTSLGYVGQALFDPAGNPIGVNSTLFTETVPERLQGTGFDLDGATPWLAATLAVQPGETFTLEFRIDEPGDGVWPSCALLDGFEWLAAGAATGLTATRYPIEPQ
jgi:hypothetical protein